MNYSLILILLPIILILNVTCAPSSNLFKTIQTQDHSILKTEQNCRLNKMDKIFWHEYLKQLETLMHFAEKLQGKKANKKRQNFLNPRKFNPHLKETNSATVETTAEPTSNNKISSVKGDIPRPESHTIESVFDSGIQETAGNNVRYMISPRQDDTVVFVPLSTKENIRFPTKPKQPLVNSNRFDSADERVIYWRIMKPTNERNPRTTTNLGSSMFTNHIDEIICC